MKIPAFRTMTRQSVCTLSRKADRRRNSVAGIEQWFQLYNVGSVAALIAHVPIAEYCGDSGERNLADAAWLAVTPVTRGTALISWSGSMFESLVMRGPARSLLEESDRLVVRRQIEYGGELGLP